MTANIKIDEAVEMNVNDRFTVRVKHEPEGYVVDFWKGETLIDTAVIWDDDLDDIEASENGEYEEDTYDDYRREN